MAFHFNFDFIKKHPVGSGAAIIIGGLTLYLLLHGSSGGSSVAVNPQAAGVQQANAQLSIQQDAEQAHYAELALQSTTQQNLATLAAYQNITLGTQSNDNQALQINKQADVSQAAIAAQLAEATLTSNNQTQVQMAGIAANAQMQANQLQAAVDQTNTLAGVQTHISDTNAALQQNIASINSQAQVAITQINANTQTSIANIQSSTAKNSSDNSSWVSTVGTIAGVAAAFL